MSRRRSEPPGQDPAEQPLWRGQLAPVEGDEAPADETRRTPAWFGPHTVRILVGFVLVCLVAAAVIWWVRHRTPEPLSVRDLERGDCVTSTGLGDANGDLDDLTRTSCDRPHDAEVFASFEAGSGVTDLEAAGRRCGEVLEAAGPSLRDITERGLEVRPLTASGEISPETRVVCFVRNRSGERMLDTMVVHATEPHAED